MRPAASPPPRWRATATVPATVPIPVVRRHSTVYTTNDTTNDTPNETPNETKGRSGWHWLLAVPAVAPLFTPLYNRTEPAFAGIPFFYWCQLAFVGLVVGVITLVYQATEGAATTMHKAPGPSVGAGPDLGRRDRP
jgi:Protein of unknown function (DUF3311)